MSYVFIFCWLMTKECSTHDEYRFHTPTGAVIAALWYRHNLGIHPDRVKIQEVQNEATAW